jgi:hypothetical protein
MRREAKDDEDEGAAGTPEHCFDIGENVDYDMQSIRSRRLTEELIKIGDWVPTFDCPDVKEEDEINQLVLLFQLGKTRNAEKSRDLTAMMGFQNLIKKVKKFCWVRESAHYALEDLEYELKFRQLSCDDYVSVRLNINRERYGRKADHLDWILLFYKVATYAIGALSAFLSYMSLEVSESTLCLVPPFLLLQYKLNDQAVQIYIWPNMSLCSTLVFALTILCINISLC